MSLNLPPTRTRTHTRHSHSSFITSALPLLHEDGSRLLFDSISIIITYVQPVVDLGNWEGLGGQLGGHGGLGGTGEGTGGTGGTVVGYTAWFGTVASFPSLTAACTQQLTGQHSVFTPFG